MGAVVRHRAFRHFLLMILALLVLVAIGTAGYWLLEGMETIDAVYMTVITISTVGYGEVKTLSPMGRLFTIGLIVSGGGIAAYTFSSTATFLDEITHATGLELLLEQVHLKPTSPLVGKTLAQAQLRGKLGITVLACKPLGEKPDTKPGTDTVLQADAQIIALGTRNQLRELEKLAGI